MLRLVVMVRTGQAVCASVFENSYTVDNMSREMRFEQQPQQQQREPEYEMERE